MDYLAKRQQIVDRHKLLESVPDSPWSPEHHLMRHEMIAGAKILSERPVAIQDDDRIHVVGPCVDLVKAAFLAFLKRTEEKQEDLLGNGIKFQEASIKNIKRALAQGDHLEMPTQDWNYCLGALVAQGVRVVIVGA